MPPKMNSDVARCCRVAAPSGNAREAPRIRASLIYSGAQPTRFMLNDDDDDGGKGMDKSLGR